MKIQFLKDKYGKEQLVDCFNIKEIAGKTFSWKELHASNFYEIYFFFEGGGTVFLEAEKIEIQSPVVLLMPPLQPRKWNLNDDANCMMTIFEGDFMEAFMKDTKFLNRLYLFRNLDVPPLLPAPEEEMSSYRYILKNIQKEVQSQASDSFHLLRAYLYQLLILLNRNYISYYKLKENLYSNLEMLQFKELIQQHIHEKQTVKEYAELLKISRNRLTQLCQDFFGKDAQTIIHNELLKSCKNDLLLTNKTINEISYDHNFSAPSNFVRFFKNLTRVSPALYRKEFAN